jgi:malonyl CoA-acyl carrier protein transacylase
MDDTSHSAIAVVGVSAILPDAPSAAAFWENVKGGRYSVSDVTPDRWDPALYFDEDHRAPDKTYSKIGGWVRSAPWEPTAWKIAIPPKVAAAMDEGQRWAVACARAALIDYGYPDRPLDLERTAVILGNAMGGEQNYRTTLRATYPELAQWLEAGVAFGGLSAPVRQAILAEWHAKMGEALPPITEDTMPGELSNCVAGRIANLFNFRGPNFTCDAACASAMAALSAAREGLIAGDYDAVLTGGVDRNMGASTFVKFSKIGALSATGSRPFAQGSDGFVMGEGSALFLLKRLADAEAAGDRIYAVVRGMGASSDGKGKGITAPNPVGQKLAVTRAWKNAGIAPLEGMMIEAHGTSTPVGDVVEVDALGETLGGGLRPGSVALGSVKSNIGHLKSAAGAAGLLKVVLSLHEKVLPPSLNFKVPNPNVDWPKSPFQVNTQLRGWERPAGGVRTAGLSAFGFGGTNFHMVLEEHVPGRLPAKRPRGRGVDVEAGATQNTVQAKAPLRGALLIGADTEAELIAKVQKVRDEAKAGRAPDKAPPKARDLKAKERLAIDYADAAELAAKAEKAEQAMRGGSPAAWRALRNQGVFRGRGPAPKVAFLFTGQGSQYANMLRDLRAREPVVHALFDEADRTLTPLIGRPLSEIVFCDPKDEAAVKQAEEALKQTAVTQPAVLTTDLALTKLLESYGVRPDMVMGHSLGEYGALVAAGCLSFQDALEAVSARGREMSHVAVGDAGMMAAVVGPIEKVEAILREVTDYVVIANVNSNKQVVIGGSTAGVKAAVEKIQAAKMAVVTLAVSHAFHTSIVAPASAPLKVQLERFRIGAPKLPIVANVNGELYPANATLKQMIDILGEQVAAPVQFVKGLQTLYAQGARVFIEVGPKKALQGFAEDVLGDKEDVLTLGTNHPKLGDVVSFNHALCGLFARGLGVGAEEPVVTAPVVTQKAPVAVAPVATARPVAASAAAATAGVGNGTGGAMMRASAGAGAGAGSSREAEIGRMFLDLLDRAGLAARGGEARTNATVAAAEPVVITGAALGLPGTPKIFDDANVGRILSGAQLIDSIPSAQRKAMVDKRVTRLVKKEGQDPVFETIDDVDHVIKLAGRGGSFDLSAEYGVPADRAEAFDITTRMAIAVALDTLRDAGIPLVPRYRATTKGTFLPDGWSLPESMRDDTGIIFASAFPGYNELIGDLDRFHEDRARRDRLAELQALRARVAPGEALAMELDRRIAEVAAELEKHPFAYDRRFLFKVLAMGHSQLAEYIHARGPNTQMNSACASTTQAISMAQDWIARGRCRRVLVLGADDITSDRMLSWFASGFLAAGAAATDERVTDAATPFDRRRHGLIVGMGAAGVLVESESSARERGVSGIGELLGTVTANSAFHGTRLDVDHITAVMERLVSEVEAKHGLTRDELARQMVFVSHETYTPARGGSAAAEIFALRHVFGAVADSIVIANTKGFTGHPMAAGIEDAIAVKALETGIVPPVPNFKEVDPDLGTLNLSKGGSYPIEFALRLAAGFGSQISMTLTRRATQGARPAPEALGFQQRVADPAAYQRWLAEVSGYATPQVEVVKRTLRVHDQGPTARVAATATKAKTVPPPAAQPKPIAPPTQAAQPTQAPATPPKAAPAVDTVAERVLALVTEKTGYPRDMLALDLDLEADLGIDTVKQAEVFATIRQAYDIPRDDSVKLRDYPTLGHVIGFVKARRPDLAATAAPVPETAVVATAAPVAAASGVDEVAERVLSLVTEKTGYPRDMLALDLDLEADLGIDTVKQAEVFATIRQAYDIPRDDSVKLRDYPTLGHVIGFVKARRPDLVGTSAVAAPVAVAASAPVAASPAAPVAVAAAGVDEVAERVLALVTEKTGYPRDMLDLDLDLEADLGIDTVKQAEVFATIRQAYDIPRDDSVKLRDYPTLGHVIGFVKARRPDLAAPAPVAAPVAAAAPTPAPAAGEVDEVAERVLALVTEKTGYPRDMLDLDLDLEADLGIDTVKQAEVFATIRQAYDIPRDDSVKLRDYPTLGHVIGFVKARRPVTASAGTGAGTTAKAAPKPVALEQGKYPRRVPVPVLRPALAVCKTTSVTLAGKRVLVMADAGGAATALAEALRAQGATVLPIEATSTPTREELGAAIEGWLAAGAIDGVYWLPALDAEGPLAALDAETFRRAVHVRAKLAHATTRALYTSLDQPGAFFLSATRLGGRHGYDADGARAPLGGAVVGFTKALARERPKAHVKSVDFALDAGADTIAATLIEETLRDPGAVEIGHADGLRWTVGLEERAVTEASPSLAEAKTIVVTGAAGSITAAITADLAASSGATFYLLDRVPAPDLADRDLARLATDREGLKRELFERLKARGERATPALVEREIAALERGLAAKQAIEAVTAAGGKARWLQADLRDGEAISRAVATILGEAGSIDVLVHAAGLEISRLVPDKSADEFDLVFDVKAEGMFHLLRAIGDAKLGALVVFSSIAGRFGNGGQTDYSAANDLLCKIASSVRSQRPSTRGLAIDWTAWADIGMASRGSIPKLMELAGIEMLPPQVGIPVVRQELARAVSVGEVVLAGTLGKLLEERDPDGGIDAHAFSGLSGPMVGRVARIGLQEGVIVETTLDPKEQGFLYDHRIDGVAVLPGVMGVEAFAEVASLLLPGWTVTAIEDVDFLAPFKFYRDEPRTVTVQALLEADGDGVVARCRLLGTRTIAGQAPQVTEHFRARVRLSRAPSEAASVAAPAPANGGARVASKDIYRVYFHGPAYQVIEDAWRSGTGATARIAEALPANHAPAELPTLTAPRLVESCFQTAGLWELGAHGKMGLPQHVDRVTPRLGLAQAEGRALFAIAERVQAEGDAGAYDARIVDAEGRVYVEIHGYRTVTLPSALAAELLEPLRAAMA